MSDILFITPSKHKLFWEESIGTLILASLLKQKGMDVDIYRFYEADDPDYYQFIDKTATAILTRQPKIVSFYCRCDYYLMMVRIAQELRRRKKEIYIVFGGPQADASAKETIAAMPWVDYCCSGEGETTIYPLFSALLSGGDPTGVDGLTYRTADGDIVQNRRPPMLQNLDESPRIDYSLVPDEVIQKTIDCHEPISIDVGRGCPFNCTYCSTSLFWQRRFRLKSNERILDEMREFYEKYGITHFKFTHDLFTGSKKRVLDFCRKLKESGMPFHWTCSSRIDTIDEEMIAAMKDAGLYAIYFGVESGSERIQKLIKKNLDPEQAFQIVCLMKKYKLHATVSLIYGFPEETEEDVSKTMALAFRMKEEYRSARLQFHLLTIFHGSEMFETYRDKLTFAPMQTDIVQNFGTEENLDFICEHKEIFPYYYEYRSPLRTKLSHLERFMLMCMSEYSVIRLFLPRYRTKQLIDFYYDFLNVNKPEFDQTDSFQVYYTPEQKDRMLQNYINAVLPEPQRTAAGEVLRFTQWRRRFMKSGKELDIEQFNADIRAYLNGAPLDGISTTATQVGLYMQDGKCSISIT